MVASQSAAALGCNKWRLGSAANIKRGISHFHTSISLERGNTKGLTNDSCESAEKGEESTHDEVKDLVCRHLVGQVGVEDGESDGGRQVDVRLQEGDDLSTGVWGSDDQDILGVSEDGVVEEDEEQHGAKRENLLQSLGARVHLLLWSRSLCSVGYSGVQG